MCGIAGIVHFDQRPVQKNDLAKMTAFLQERGPDHTGYWIDDSVGLAHTRLSIIDLDPRSNQPMVLNDPKVSISFNGEIYNFLELKAELQKAGVSFRTTSDTEVLLQGYLNWGVPKLLGKIRGMFAFTIVDRSKNKFFLVRDHFGKKPLYYSISKRSVIFSSDIKSVKSMVPNDPSLDFESLDYFLSEFSVPQPKSIWKEISQLPPSYWMECSLDVDDHSISAYWTGPAPPAHNSYSNLEIIDITEQKLRDAIRLRTIADVPIACFLSGGVDSGLITSLLAQSQPGAVNTFSVGFSFEEENELPDAAIVAKRYNTNHHELVLEPNVLEDLIKIIEYIGEPFADPSCIPTYYITRFIGNSFKVALSGDGGDELFGGYDDYGLAFKSEQFYRENPNDFTRGFKVLADKISSRFQGNRENMGSFQAYLDKKDYQRLDRQMGFSFGQKDQLYSNKSRLNNEYTKTYLQATWEKHRASSLTGTLLRASLRTRLLNDYLVKVDRVSMMNSLEVRSPFLDINLADWAFSIPNEHKFNSGHSKYILKKIAERHVRPGILSIKKKGFGLPLAKWLQQDMHEWMKSILLDHGSIISEMFDRSYIHQLINENKSSRLHGNRLWALICLSLWGAKCR